MRHPPPYLKMRALGAIDMAEGKAIVAHIRAVSQATFADEDGQPRRSTCRTDLQKRLPVNQRSKPDGR